nr:MAG TPA: hypothetical protein [Caudoviricetes sp.]
MYRTHRLHITPAMDARHTPQYVGTKLTPSTPSATLPTMRHEHLPMPLIAPILGIIAHALLPKHIAGGPYKTLQALATLQVTQGAFRPDTPIQTTVSTIADMIGLTYAGTRDALTSLMNSKAIAWTTPRANGSHITVDWLAAGLPWEAYRTLTCYQEALWTHLAMQAIQDNK